jgi:hypothetical protein
MNRFKLFSLLLTCLAASCRHQPLPPIPCGPPPAALVITTTASQDSCTGTGRIALSGVALTGYQFRLVNGNYQSTPVFSGLLPGRYRVQASNNNSCFYTDTITVPQLPQGSKFAQVKNLLVQRCRGCHAGVNPQAGLDFNRSCNIIENWNRIEARAVFGNPSPMPQAGLLPVAERSIISNWIAAGHRFTD